MLNLIVLEGRLVADPEMRYTTTGTPVASFRLAVDRPFTNQSGNKETDFFSVTAWRKLGETVANNLTKGSLVSVQGRMQMRQYETQDGAKRTVYDVNADAVNFLGRRPGSVGDTSKEPDTTQDPQTPGVKELPDDLPF